MFYFFQKQKGLLLFVCLLVAGCLGWTIWENHITFSTLNIYQPYTQSLELFTQQHPLPFLLAVIILFCIQGMAIYAYFQRGNFSEKNKRFTLFWFLLLALTGRYLTPVSAPFIINTIIIILLHLNLYRQEQNYINRALISGILVGIASLYDAAALILIIYVIAAIFINASKVVKNILVLAIGFLLTHIYVFAYHFFFGSLDLYVASLSQLKIELPQLTPSDFMALAVLMPTMIVILLKIKIAFDNKLIIIRKSITLMLVLLLTSAAMTIFSAIPFPQSSNYMLIPFTLYFSIYVPEQRRAISQEFTLLCAAAAWIVTQWV